jgi:hypothetical protein
VACPYFVPREMLNDGSWPHPSRLPLGAGWTGACCTSEPEVVPGLAHIREFCNLGYASSCPHLPARRDWDAVRFSVSRSASEQITIAYVCERAHAPIEHGSLTYDLTADRWSCSPADERVNRLATSYLRAWRLRQNGAPA